MKVCLSGLGYIGTVLAKELLEVGYEVYGVDNLMYGSTHITHLLDYPNFHFKSMNICNREYHDLAAKCNMVIHLAAIVGKPACDKHPITADIINNKAVQNLCKNLPKDIKIIFPSTNSGYGTGVDCTEETPTNPLSGYAKQKEEAEKAVLDRGNSAVLRLATVFGRSPRFRCDLLLNDFVSKIWLHNDIEIYEPNFKRNVVHVKDVARGLMWFMDDYEGLYNFGLPTENPSKLELAQHIFKELDIEEKIIIGQGTDEDKRNYSVSNKKLLKTEFKFKYGILDGIKEVAELCNLYGPSIRQMGNI